MKKIFVSIFIIVFAAHLHAQQLHFTSQYIPDNYLYNPAAAGMTATSSVGATYRSMWSGIDGGPKTAMVYGDLTLPKLKAGLAGYIYNDVTGPTRRTGVNLGYSYHIVSQDGKRMLGIGLELRALQFYYDMNKLSQYIPNDPILAGVSNKVTLDGGAGIYWKAEKYSIGASVSQLIQSKIKLATIANATEESQLYRHFYFTAHYDFNTGDNILITPNVMVAVVPHAPTEYTFGAIVNYQDKLYWGAGWRIDQSWMIQAGYTFNKKLQIGYAHDIYQTPLSVFTIGGGADEVMLKYNFIK